MKILAVIFFLSAPQAIFAADTYVQGYTNSHGTYVQPYNRTAPNETRNDNYSTRGNTNPYTGSEGTKPADSGQNRNYNGGSQY